MELGQMLLIAITIAVLTSGPLLFISGWFLCIRRPREAGVFPALSLLGFVIGSLSTLLAAGAFVYGQAIGGFPYYDPRLLRIVRLGLILSLVAILFGLAGVWKRSP